MTSARILVADCCYATRHGTLARPRFSIWQEWRLQIRSPTTSDPIGGNALSTSDAACFHHWKKQSQRMIRSFLNYLIWRTGRTLTGGMPRGTVDFGKRLSAVMSIRLLVRKYRRQKELFTVVPRECVLYRRGHDHVRKTELRVRVLLAVQQSLLGSVGPNLRAVTCSWNSSAIQIRAIFDLAISETDKENMSEVEAEIMSHFPDQEVAVSCTRVNAPAMICANPNEVFVFKRRE